MHFKWVILQNATISLSIEKESRIAHALNYADKTHTKLTDQKVK